MTMTFSLDNPKLSNRWSQLFNQCLDIKSTQAPASTEETPESLHAYMMEKIAAHRAA